MDLANYNATKTYEYDATNLMVGGKNEKGEASHYTYNGMGALVSHTATTHQNGVAQTVKTDYVIDYTSAAQLELANFGSNGIDTKYTYGIGLNKVSATVNNRHTGDKTRLNIQTDRLGSGRQATNATGQVVAHTMLDEWGMVLEKVTPTVGGVEVDVIGNFTNHEWDSVLEIYYAKARFYDPNTMRFQAVDPIKDGLNWYAYCYNNPINYIDPLGLWGTGHINERFPAPQPPETQTQQTPTQQPSLGDFARNELEASGRVFRSVGEGAWGTVRATGDTILYLANPLNAINDLEYLIKDDVKYYKNNPNHILPDIGTSFIIAINSIPFMPHTHYNAYQEGGFEGLAHKTGEDIAVLGLMLGGKKVSNSVKCPKVDLKANYTPPTKLGSSIIRAYPKTHYTLKNPLNNTVFPTIMIN